MFPWGLTNPLRETFIQSAWSPGWSRARRSILSSPPNKGPGLPDILLGWSDFQLLVGGKWHGEPFPSHRRAFCHCEVWFCPDMLLIVTLGPAVTILASVQALGNVRVSVGPGLPCLPLSGAHYKKRTTTTFNDHFLNSSVERGILWTQELLQMSHKTSLVGERPPFGD